MAAFLYVMDHGVPDLSSVPGLSSWGPKLKVEYGYFLSPAFDCPGGHCQQPNEKRLKVQSVSEQPILIKDLIVNDRADCVFLQPCEGQYDVSRRRELRRHAVRTHKGPGFYGPGRDDLQHAMKLTLSPLLSSVGLRPIL
jgi:hypothetical protein